MSSYSGLDCPQPSQFYVCDNFDASSGKNPFIGCCEADPCLLGTGCGKYFTPTFDPKIWNNVPEQTCSDPDARWFACPNGSFLGCCGGNQDPCGGGSCAREGPGRLSPDPNKRNDFVSLANRNKQGGAESTTSTKPLASTSLSSTSTRNARPSAPPSSTSHGPSALPPKQAQSASPELSTGSIAGIAVGSAVAGLLLGVLAAFFLFRRREQRKFQPEYVHMPYAPGKGGKDVSGAPAARDAVQLGQFLLAPKPDHEMTTELGSLGALVQQHVENHYHQQPVSQSAKPLAQALVALGFAGSHRSSSSPEALVRLAFDARTRFAALQHVITRVAFDSVVLALPGSSSSSSATAPGPPVSLLPPAVAAFARSVPATERHRGNSEAVAAAMIKWRQLSAFLLHPNRSDRTPFAPSGEATAQQAQQLALELNRFLEPFVLRGRERSYEQESHLQQVLTECARFGYVLFSQPSEYRFDYDDQGRLSGIVVCPGLERVSDEEGWGYMTPQVLAAPVIEDA